MDRSNLGSVGLSLPLPSRYPKRLRFERHNCILKPKKHLLITGRVWFAREEERHKGLDLPHSPREESWCVGDEAAQTCVHLKLDPSCPGFYYLFQLRKIPSKLNNSKP